MSALRRAALPALALVTLLAAPATAGSDGLRSLARCLEESGAVFFGAHWCPYCQRQLAAFGEAAALLPYVECSDPGSRAMRPRCRQEGVRSYPTWTFADGKVVKGLQRPEALASLSGCPAP